MEVQETGTSPGALERVVRDFSAGFATINEKDGVTTASGTKQRSGAADTVKIPEVISRDFELGLANTDAECSCGCGGHGHNQACSGHATGSGHCGGCGHGR